MSRELRYMQPDELAAQLSHKSIEERGTDGNDKIAILDVRGEDEYAEDGHIKGAINLPSTQWYTPGFVDKLVQEYADNNVTVVLHCAYSQQRGPTCARMLMEGFERGGTTSTAVDVSAIPQVYVLKGGFVLFCGKYGSNSDLVNGGISDTGY